MGKGIYIHILSWSKMPYEKLNVLQTYIWARVPKHVYSPKNNLFSKAQLFSMWCMKVYAAISNLSLESGIIVSGLLSCNLLLGMTVSLHSWRQLLIMSDVEMIFPQSEHDISPPWISVHNSLRRACQKVHGSCSWNMFWSISCLWITSLFSFRLLCVMHNSSP